MCAKIFYNYYSIMSNLRNANRKLICQNLEEGRNSIRGLAATFQVSYPTIKRVWDHYNDTGEHTSKRKGGNKRKLLSQQHIDYVRELIDENLFITLKDIKEKVEAIDDITVSISTIHRVIGDFNYTLKRVIFRPIQGETEEMWESRRVFSNWLLRQQNEEQNSIFFLDETGFKVEMRSVYGRSKKGVNAETMVPNIRSRNISVIAALSNKGIVHYEILNGPGNSDRFSRFIDDLAHARDAQGYRNDTIIVMDNVAFHKSPVVREMMELRGFECHYLPPYSPYLNPIESLFSQWKNLIKTLLPTCEADLMAAINNINTVVTSNHCANYCRHVRTNCLKILDGHRENFN